jgi:thiosulfate/3-mercaptopyruvate sulfurtransferase
VNDDSTVVIYDDSVTALASRLYFLLELYGFDMTRVKILDGGTVGWSAFNDLTKEPARPKRGDVSLKPANGRLLVEWTDVYGDVVARRDPNIVLLDSRPREMHTGKTIQHANQGGHIPRVVDIVSPEGVEGQSQRWRSAEALAVLYRALPKDKTRLRLLPRRLSLEPRLVAVEEPRLRRRAHLQRRLGRLEQQPYAARGGRR